MILDINNKRYRDAPIEGFIDCVGRYKSVQDDN